MLVSRACPALFSNARDESGEPITAEEYIRYYLPQERGWSYIHAHLLIDGNAMEWPDERNPDVRWINRVFDNLKLKL